MNLKTNTAQIKTSSSIFIRILGPILNDYENIVAYSEQSKQSEGISEQVWFVLNLFWGSEGWCHPEKCGCFYSLFLLFLKYKHIFFFKTRNLILNWIPSLSPTIIPCLKDHPNNQFLQTL